MPTDSLPSHSSYLELVINASIPVQLVMLLLILASLVSWYRIDQKRKAYKQWTRIADHFESQFWSGGDIRMVYQEWHQNDQADGIVNIFLSGVREFNRLAKKQNVARADVVNGVHRSMRVALSKEITDLESSLAFLATVGSTTPYIGLFGTVWGIMNSFRELGSLQQVTIATVAPGIAEALIATAMGLFAAIPAVIAYNNYASTSERLATRYEVFVEEFLSIINRQDIGNNDHANQQ